MAIVTAKKVGILSQIATFLVKTMSNKATKNLGLVDVNLNQQRKVPKQLGTNQQAFFSKQLEKFQSLEEVVQQIVYETIATLLKSLLALTNLLDLGILEFGYRQFLNDGTTIGFCTRCNNKIDWVSNGCNAKAKVNTKEKEKPSDYRALKQFYNQESNNSLAVFKRTKNKIEGFYFLASSSSPEIIQLYISHFEYFNRFINLVIFYVNKILGDIKSAGAFCEKLYVKVFSQNALKALFSELMLS